MRRRERNSGASTERATSWARCCPAAAGNCAEPRSGGTGASYACFSTVGIGSFHSMRKPVYVLGSQFFQILTGDEPPARPLSCNTVGTFVGCSFNYEGWSSAQKLPTRKVVRTEAVWKQPRLSIGLTGSSDGARARFVSVLGGSAHM